MTPTPCHLQTRGPCVTGSRQVSGLPGSPGAALAPVLSPALAPALALAPTLALALSLSLGTCIAQAAEPAAAQAPSPAAMSHRTNAGEDAGIWFNGKERQRYPSSRLAELEPSLLLSIEAFALEEVRRRVSALGHRLEPTRMEGVFLLRLGPPAAVQGQEAGQSVTRLEPAQPAPALDPLRASLQLEGMAGIVSIELNRRLALRFR